ncbi:MAG: UDP-N-acetylmuramate dehydrogenase [Nitrospinae bacterium]|nr:UDP-N-acetylmuramate dehydrogenase [Nitrospinota bacterium]
MSIGSAEEVMALEMAEKLKNLECEILFDERLAPFTTFQVGGPADALALPTTEDDLVELIERCRSEALPVTVLGGGANTLVRDGGVRGVVIAFPKAFRGIEVIEEGADRVLLEARAGEKIPALVRFAAERGWAGTECLAGVPGTVGGALAMNAGTAESYIEDAVESVRWVPLDGGVPEWLPVEALHFSYRRTELPAPGVVLSVRFSLRQADAGAIREQLMRSAVQRRERQPWGVPCAGSIFKNPPGERAGVLIESAGLKGMRIGGAQVSEVHGNFMVNLGGATATDVLALIEEVKRTILEQKGIELALELNVIGEDPA